jgi:hypothetical protein
VARFVGRLKPGTLRVLAWVMGAMALLVVLAAVAVVRSADSGEETYSPEVQAAFMDACSADGGPPAAPVCACFYESVATEISYQRFDIVNRQLLESPPATGEPVELPADFETLLEECREHNAVTASAD